MGRKLDKTLAVLNGLLGDYLASQGNGLATDMACYHRGQHVPLERDRLRQTQPKTTPRVAFFVHGTMCTEDIWRFPDGSDYGRKLQADLDVTPFYVRYNTGLPIADNGAAFARLLDSFVRVYPEPLEELILIGFSMGGLVVRSACHFAAEHESAWLSHVRRAIYIGTPHVGAPAERVGRAVTGLLRTIPDPYTRLIGELGDLRSAGIKDLGDADLRHEDRASTGSRLSLRDPRHPVPLLPGIRHALVAGSLWMDTHVLPLFGDSLVPLGSATGQGLADADDLEIPAKRIKVLPGRSHLDLPRDEEVYRFIEEQVRS